MTYVIIIISLNQQQSFRYPVSVLNSTTLRLTFAINMTVDKIEKSSKTQFLYNFNNFIANLNKLETLSEVNNSFYSMFEYIVSRIGERKSETHDALISKVIKIINSNYQDPTLSLDYIADIVNMSPIYLGKLFKKATFKSVADYINDLRLEKARILLIESSRSISKIVEEVGFSSGNYFSILFKKTYSISPSEYRKCL